MMEIIKQNNEVIKHLQAAGSANFNVLAFLAYDSDADVYTYGGDIANGVIVGDADRDFFYLATHNRDFLEEFWQFLPSGHKVFSGVPTSIANILTEGKKIVWQSPCKVFVYDGVTPIADFKTDFEIKPLTPEDAEDVDNHYTYQHEGSIDELRESIQKMDSACIRIDGRLASWCLVHVRDGSLGPLYTKKEFRGRGLAEAVAAHLLKTLVAKNQIPYAQIVDDNAPSLALIKKLGGMDYVYDCLWFGLNKE